MIWQLVILGSLLSLLLYKLFIRKCRLRIKYITLVIMISGCFLPAIWLSMRFPSLYFLIKLILFLILSSGIFLVFIMIHFFRDPNRNPPQEKHVILSPADGVIRYIHPIKNGTVPISIKKNRKFKITELMNQDLTVNGGYLIGVEMSLIDVHVNRAPVDGQIIDRKRNQGKFLSLRTDEAIAENERVTTIFDAGQFKLAVIQIASRFVRRIESYYNKGDHVQIGQRIGRITFGSQVDTVIPNIHKLNIVVQKGDCVKAGLTILARYK